ncbi:hypothetical protein QMO46_04645 [Microbacterium barkeri]|uniref:hypothetical protein n=1 Tax=Microbacterium barkeri TaxID=33917 RepID=UPI0024AEDF25|nr:hypothetical protein [Microbacterium barkeri]MDI6942780.1 hypothetical protein [Microbacterium barkeri]
MRLHPPTDAQVASMRRKIFAEIARNRARRRSRLTITAATTALVVAVTTAGAILVEMAKPDDLNVSFDCYTTADLSAPHGTTSFVDDDRDRDRTLALEDRVAQALEFCMAGYNAVPTDGDVEMVRVVNPTVCMMQDRRLAVLPNEQYASTEDFCEGLGLAAPFE